MYVLDDTLESPNLSPICTNIESIFFNIDTESMESLHNSNTSFIVCPVMKVRTSFTVVLRFVAVVGV